MTDIIRDAEAALLALGGTLLWEPNTFVVSGEVKFDFLPGEIARTEKGTYAVLTARYPAQVSLAGVPLTIDVTFFSCRADNTPGSIEFPAAPYANEAAARAACEYHHATGRWE